MIRVGKIQNRIAQQHQQLFVFAFEDSCQRLFASFYDDAFPHPLPELSLRGPELFSVSANYECRFLLALVLLNFRF